MNLYEQRGRQDGRAVQDWGQAEREIRKIEPNQYQQTPNKPTGMKDKMKDMKKSNQQPQQYEIGMVGLGVMGRNLLLNMADHGVPVAGYDKDPPRSRRCGRRRRTATSAARRTSRSSSPCFANRARS